MELSSNEQLAPMTIKKKIKILGATNSAHLPKKWARLAELAVLFSW